MRTLVRGVQEGRRSVRLNASSLSSGIYFLRLQTEEVLRTQRLTVVR